MTRMLWLELGSAGTGPQIGSLAAVEIVAIRIANGHRVDRAGADFRCRHCRGHPVAM